MTSDIVSYRDELLPAVVRFWNGNFSDRLNFFNVTEDLFRIRVVERRTAIESFDPAGLLLAVENNDVVGMIHAGIQPEEFCRAVDGNWGGGSRGYVALICVDRDRRRRGIGKRLWDRAMEYLAGTAGIIVDGQCLNMFYGNSDAPIAPFWGTPEGISILWNDDATRNFLAQRGFQPRFRAIHLRMSLNDVKTSSPPTGIDLSIIDNRIPILGASPDEASPVPAEFRAFVALRGGAVVSSLIVYRLAEVAPDAYAIYEMQTLDAFQGKGIGRSVLAAAMRDMMRSGGTSCQVLTVPDLSPAAEAFYRNSGFTPIAEWAIY